MLMLQLLLLCLLLRRTLSRGQPVDRYERNNLEEEGEKEEDDEEDEGEEEGGCHSLFYKSKGKGRSNLMQPNQK